MTDADLRLAARARRAYERGRVLSGVRRAAVVLPMAGLSLAACGRPAVTTATVLVLAIAIVACEWRGGEAARGCRAGLRASLPALVLPVLVRACGHVCTAALCGLYSPACVAGGALGGFVLVRRAAPARLDGTGLAIAALVTLAAGSLGCLVAGAGGILGLVAGLAVGLTPALVPRRA